MTNPNPYLIDLKADPVAADAYVKARTSKEWPLASPLLDPKSAPAAEVKLTPLQQLDARQVVYIEPPPKPVDVVTFKGQSICTAGNLTVIAGQAKAGKTAALAALIACVIAKDKDRDFLGFESPPNEGKSIMVFDTEQAPYDAWRLQDRALRQAGFTEQPKCFIHYYLLDMETGDRREAFFDAVRREHKEKGIHLIVLDGIADLLDDPNEQAVANPLVSEVIALSVEIEAPIVLVLHENPAAPGGAGKTRGHLGSQLERKAESNLRVVKDSEGVSSIFGEKCRRAYLPLSDALTFVWDDAKGMHVSTGTRKEAREDAEIEKLDKLMKGIYAAAKDSKGFTYKGILAKIEELQGVRKEGARKWFDKLKGRKLIRKTETDELWVRTENKPLPPETPDESLGDAGAADLS